jgi:SNF2 family DNA or RNA helicase
VVEPSVYIDGSTPAKRRQGLVDQFNDPAGPRVMLGQLHTMGVAINPHEHCSHMLFVERDWSAAVLEQAVNRVRRLGQTQHQQIDFLDTDHPLDARMARTANKKLKSMGILMGDTA